jgi:hypothetical protein
VCATLTHSALHPHTHTTPGAGPPQDAMKMVALNGSVTTIEQSLLENTSHPRFAMRKVRPSATARSSAVSSRRRTADLCARTPSCAGAGRGDQDGGGLLPRPVHGAQGKPWGAAGAVSC